MTSFFTTKTESVVAEPDEPKDQGLEDAADVDCTAPAGWTPTEAFDDLAKEKH